MIKTKREKCAVILGEMDSSLTDIRMQWDIRHYSSLSIIKKIESLGENILNFNFFYRKYVERCEREMEPLKGIEELLKEKD